MTLACCSTGSFETMAAVRSCESPERSLVFSPLSSLPVSSATTRAGILSSTDFKPFSAVREFMSSRTHTSISSSFMPQMTSANISAFSEISPLDILFMSCVASFDCIVPRTSAARSPGIAEIVAAAASGRMQLRISATFPANTCAIIRTADSGVLPANASAALSGPRDCNACDAPSPLSFGRISAISPTAMFSSSAI